jgi:hypothetical protein
MTQQRRNNGSLELPRHVEKRILDAIRQARRAIRRDLYRRPTVRWTAVGAVYAYAEANLIWDEFVKDHQESLIPRHVWEAEGRKDSRSLTNPISGDEVYLSSTSIDNVQLQSDLDSCRALIDLSLSIRMLTEDGTYNEKIDQLLRAAIDAGQAIGRRNPEVSKALKQLSQRKIGYDQTRRSLRELNEEETELVKKEMRRLIRCGHTKISAGKVVSDELASGHFPGIKRRVPLSYETLRRRYIN